jgi:hypothetical protein
MLNLLVVLCFVLKPDVSMQCTCIDISMAELRESGESMQFLEIIEHANAKLTIKEATEPPTFGR